MYNLTIHFGPNAVAWSFLFKDMKSAEAAFDTLQANISAARTVTYLTDDYGQRSLIILPIHGVLLEDMEAGQEARIIRGIDQAKGQMRANKRAQSDPEIQQFAKEQNRSPGIISPMGANGFGRHQ